MTVTIEPVEVIAAVAAPLIGLPACIAGSSVAAETYDLPLTDSSDIDVFVYSEGALFVAAQKLLSAGFNLNERHDRVWDRWLRYGLRNWHTNSIKFDMPSGVEVNVVYKLLGGKPTSSLSQVLESFDFGLLGVGYDLSQGSLNKQDLRAFLFPGYDIDGPLPLMPNKRADWRRGLISQYNGLREMGRYAKYYTYGHDLTLVKDDLVEGYRAVSMYMAERDDPEKQKLGLIYETCAMKVEDDDIAALLAAGKEIPFMDSLDQIMEALE